MPLPSPVCDMATHDRLTLSHDPAPHVHSLAEDVLTGLQTSPKRLSSCHLYDDLGSALFEAITLLPEYSITRAETEILEHAGGEIINHLALNGAIDLIELGSGSGRKTSILIETALRRQAHLFYHPIDVSRSSLITSAAQLLSAHDKLFVTAFVGDYRNFFRLRAFSSKHRTLVLFLGSSIGNYAPPEAIELLRTISSAVQPGSALLLGADLKKSKLELELAYNDPTGVTACFNRNILGRINRELGGHFDLGSFRYVVNYNEERGCIDSSQESTRSQRIKIDALDAEIPFAEGERIHIESSYKYDQHDLADLARASNFKLDRTWTDTQGSYSLNLLIT
ncbi:MAG TPA: L-histidine N(alpha)-methyltransferase [Candidatus Baltobacteraceae bacterium]|nr:L-histidine N(alpha)-methyltransferase [Candidatus Baltobacteraceae bacterium]